MKNFSLTITVISICLLAASLNTTAQIFIGPRLGTSFSSTTGGTQYKESIQLGAYAGVASNFWLNYKWQLQVEALYNQKGYNHVICSGGSYDRLSSTYVEMPVLMRYRAWPISTNFIMNLGFGGYFSYLIDAQYKTDLGEGEILQVLDPASLNRLSDMGLSFDIGLERQLGNGKLQIETRIQPGLGKLDFIPGEGTHRNFGVMFSLNYMFALR